jgi:hypothetical protein
MLMDNRAYRLFVPRFITAPAIALSLYSLRCVGVMLGCFVCGCAQPELTSYALMGRAWFNVSVPFKV